MIQKKTSKIWNLKLLNLLAIAIIPAIAEQPADAQVTPDNSLGAEQSIVNSSNRNGSLRQEVEGGAIRGSNLFHSFREFNIPEGQSLYFQNPIGIRNIIGRVTGGNPSNIEGTLGVSGGTANLFLLNPNGIIFGANARLDVRGSFVATTATEIQFGNQGFFSSSAPNSPALLTVNPSAFWFNQVAVASIVNRSTAAITDAPTAVLDRRGLQVPDGRSLLLLGGEVNFVGGGVNAAGGRLELGAVAGRGTVRLSWNANDLHLQFPAAIDRANISLTNGATVNASGEGGGSIQIWGRRVFVNGGSQVASLTEGAEPGGDLIVDASESVEVLGIVPFGTISTFTLADGEAGDLTIETRRLSVRDQAVLFSGTSGNGSAGQLTVNASESVEVADRDNNTEASSTLSSLTVSSGQGGNITVNTRRLILRDGGLLLTDSTIVGADGQPSPRAGDAGNLIIDASDSVELSTQSVIQASTRSSGNAGNLTINTNRLLVQDGSEINAQSLDLGSAGNITVRARSITLSDQSEISAETTASQSGNITLQVQDTLLLREGGTISTTAGMAQAGGDGGNITINSPFVVAIPNESSDITANAFTGRGGNVDITAQGIYGFALGSRSTPQSKITASSQFGTQGTIALNTPDIDPSRGVAVLPTEVTDTNALIANSCVSRRSRPGRFVITGTGGLAPQPDDLANAAFPTYELMPQSPAPDSTSVIEADRMIRTTTGEIVLGRSCE